jgi:hypothetical protein
MGLALDPSSPPSAITLPLANYRVVTGSQWYHPTVRILSVGEVVSTFILFGDDCQDPSHSVQIPSYPSPICPGPILQYSVPKSHGPILSLPISVSQRAMSRPVVSRAILYPARYFTGPILSHPTGPWSHPIPFPDVPFPSYPIHI